MLIKRLYNISEIKNTRFSYFDVENQFSGIIEIVDGQVLMDGTRLKKKGGIHKEIAALFKRLEYALQ